MKTATATSTKRPRTIAGVTSASADASRAHTLALYESALRLMQDGKYEKAHSAFSQMLASSPGDFAERIRMYMNACVQHISKGQTQFSTHEERYDYAVSLLNDGNYEDARAQLKKIIAENNQADYAFYGLAVLSSMTGDAHRQRNFARLALLREQRDDLAACLHALWNEVLTGRRRFKLYRQMKMYNDPDLNPSMYTYKLTHKSS